MKARAAFIERFAGEPDGLWDAPGRVNLIGEHTDYNGGLALPFAIPLRATVAVRLRSTGRLRAVSLQTDGMIDVDVSTLAPGTPDGWGAHPAGALWALTRDHPGAIDGADLLIDSDVPPGAGLSSSASIEVACVLALSDLAELALPRAELVHVAHRAETGFVGAPVGQMDQTASLHCRSGHALLFDAGNDTIEQIAMAPERVGLTIAVIDTRVAHSHADGAYRRRRETCEAAAAALGVPTLGELTVDDLAGIRGRIADESQWRRTRHVVTENDRVRRSVAALRCGDWVGLGELLIASHVSMRDDFAVSCPELDLAVEVAVDHGALGARMTGGGFGGCAIALAPLDSIGALAAAMGRSFAAHGFARPSVFAVAPADGAIRLA